MGLTQNLGRLSPSIFSDSSLNIGVGAAPSGSYKLEVNGKGKFSNDLTVQHNQNASSTSTFSNSDTTGLGSRQYLELTAGDVTLQLAAINTDAIYLQPTTSVSTYLGYNSAGGNALYLKPNGNVLVNTNTDAGYKFDVNGTGRFTNSANTATLSLLNNSGYPSIINMSTTTATSTARNWAIFTNGTNWGDLEFKPSAANGGDPYTTGTVALRLASTGAATFSSSVTTNGYINNYLDQGALRLYNSSTAFAGGIGTGAWVEGSATTDIAIYSANNLKIYTGSSSTAKVTIASTGAATFSNLVKGKYFNVTGTNGLSGYLIQSGDWEGNASTDLAVASESANLRFYTNGSAAERMRITSAGNLGIGITNPTGQLSLANQIPYGSTPPSSYAATNGVNGQNFLNGYYAYSSDGYGAYPRYLDIVSVGSPDGSNGGSNIRFFTNPIANSSPAVERMRITSGGNVGIGTTSPSAKLYILSNSTTQANYYAEVATASYTGSIITSLSYTASGTGWNHFIGYSDIGSTTNIKIIGNGNIQNANNSYGAISDIKLKENIIDASPKLNDLLKVKIRNYNLIGSETKQIGVIAQEIEQIFPAMIEETIDIDKDGNDLGTTTKSVKYSVFVPMLVKAIQELSNELNELKAKIK
jgi:hypothetical protein